VIRRGAQSVTYKGLFAEFGAAFSTDPLRIALGCVTTNGNISFPGTRVYVDEFQFHGVKRVIN
jgi:hypothetical protein